MRIENKCPFCGSLRIMRNERDRNNDKLIERCHCHKCDESFNIIYDLTFLYYTNDMGSKI
jgi:transposase-like protein